MFSRRQDRATLDGHTGMAEAEATTAAMTKKTKFFLNCILAGARVKRRDEERDVEVFEGAGAGAGAVRLRNERKSSSLLYTLSEVPSGSVENIGP